MYGIYRDTIKESKVVLCNNDAISGMRNLLCSEYVVDVIVTSPPYNLGINYKSYNDGVSRYDYLNWMDSWAKVACDVLSDKGSLFLNMGSKPSSPWGPFEVAGILRKYFNLQNVIHWVKSIAVPGSSESDRDYDTVCGHYKPINSKRFLNDCHEYIFHFTHNGDVLLNREAIGVPYKDKANVERWKNNKSRDLHCRGNTWFVPYETIQRRETDRPHPATFPVSIPEMCMKLHGISRINYCLDPFMGIGSTAVAAVNLGVDFVGFEIDKYYFEETMLICANLIREKKNDSI